MSRFEERCEAWWADLSEEQRAEVLDVQELMPEWMAASLGSTGILVVDVELPNTERGYMMMTRVRAWRDNKTNPLKG